MGIVDRCGRSAPAVAKAQIALLRQLFRYKGIIAIVLERLRDLVAVEQVCLAALEQTRLLVTATCGRSLEEHMAVSFFIICQMN